jgi:uncharacterized repeat protein (TIGR01451 family)
MDTLQRGRQDHAPVVTQMPRQWMAAALLTLGIGMSHATAPCNTPSAWVNDTTYNNLVASRSNTGLCIPSTTGATANLVDSALNNAAGFSLTGLGCTLTYSVKDNDAADTLPAGYYAGFKISPTGLLSAGVAATVRIETYLNGTLVEGQNVITSGIGVDTNLLDGSGLATVGFVTTQPFNDVRIRYTTLVGALFSGTVYYPVIERFCSGTALGCNTETPLSQPAYPVTVPNTLTGISGLACVGCTISNTDNLMSASTSDYATINMAVGVGSTASIAVRDQLTTYPAGTLTGFDIERPNLVNANVLAGVTLKTYLSGSLQETTSAGTLLSVNSTLLTGSAAQQVSFLTTLPFDTVQLQMTGLADAISTTRVYHAIVERFCTGPTLNCNTQTPILPTNYPVIVNGPHTGLSTGVCVGCGVLNAQNVLTTSTADYADIVLTAGVLTSGSVSVKDVLTPYAAGTFAGFIIENPNLIGANLRSGLTLKTYRNGVLQETAQSSNGKLLSVDATLLTGSSGKRQVGFITTQAFDEVQLEVTNLVGVLNDTRVYYAMFERFCAGATPNCGTDTVLTQPSYPVLIEQQHSTVEGLACVLCAINNPQFVIDNDANNYGEIFLTVGVLASGSIAVKDAVTTYPAGTYAGFDVFNSSLVGIGLLNGASITTYLHGVVQESKGGSLLSLQLLSASRQIIGFKTQQPFDEIRITVQNLADVNVGSTRVYGAVIRPAEVGSEVSGGGMGMCPATRDYGDAPASYGQAAHSVVNGIYMGSTAPDTESYALNSSNGFTDDTGDDTTAIADEGNLSLPPLSVSNSSYSVAIACTGIGTVAGWIDLNHNGWFDDTERSSALCSGGAALLTWSNITPVVGATHARFRMAFNASEVSSPIGVAATGEVEDMVLTVQQNVQITGRVFVDNSGTTGLAAHAYNGIQDDPSEVGLSGSAIDLTNCANQVIASSISNAAGDYAFDVSSSVLSSPHFCLVQHNVAGYQSVSGSVGYDRTTDTLTLSNTGANSYSGTRFGDAKLGLVLNSNGQQTAVAGGTVNYAHVLTTDAVVSPTPVTSNGIESPADLGWTSLLYRDNNCNNTIDVDDLPLTSLPQMRPIDRICVIQRVNVPAAASNGAQYISTLSASFTTLIQDGSLITGSSNTNTDTTIVGTARLDMQKQVRRVVNCQSPLTGLDAFSSHNTAHNGDYLEYQITYLNQSNKNMSQIRIHDAIPSNALFQSMTCGQTPTAASCTIETQPAINTNGAVSWLITGPIVPAAQGDVKFCVQIKPLAEQALP